MVGGLKTRPSSKDPLSLPQSLVILQEILGLGAVGEGEKLGERGQKATQEPVAGPAATEGTNQVLASTFERGNWMF